MDSHTAMLDPRLFVDADVMAYWIWMWFGFDPEIRHQLETVRQMARLSQQAPVREWPLVFIEKYDALLVVREWPDGSLTAYTTSDIIDKR